MAPKSMGCVHGCVHTWVLCTPVPPSEGGPETPPPHPAYCKGSPLMRIHCLKLRLEGKILMATRLWWEA